jgi:hypothetical protein
LFVRVSKKVCAAALISLVNIIGFRLGVDLEAVQKSVYVVSKKVYAAEWLVNIIGFRLGVDLETVIEPRRVDLEAMIGPTRVAIFYCMRIIV